MSVRAGWERMLYVGTAGSTAAVLVEDAKDVNLDPGSETHDTTVRGDGTSVPKQTGNIHVLTRAVSFGFLYNDGVSPLDVILAAARAGTALAIKIVEYNGGDTEFDGDCFLSISSPGPIADGQNVEVTCTPTRSAGRTWT